MRFVLALLMFGCNKGGSGTEDDTDTTDEGSTLSDDDAAIASSTSQASGYAEIGQLAVDDWANEISGTARREADACLAIADAPSYDETYGHWAYSVVATNCTLYGYYAISGNAWITFDNLYALPDTATQQQVAAAAAQDFAAMAAGDVDVYSTMALTDDFGNTFDMAGVSHYADAAVDNDYDATFMDERGDTIVFSWTGGATYSGDEIAWDATGTADVTTAGGITLSTDLTVDGVERATSGWYAHAGSVTVAIGGNLVEERSVTVTFSEDTPSTGEIEVTTGGGQSGTVDLPVP